jgi:hypothetical protein
MSWKIVTSASSNICSRPIFQIPHEDTRRLLSGFRDMIVSTVKRLGTRLLLSASDEVIIDVDERVENAPHVTAGNLQIGLGSGTQQARNAELLLKSSRFQTAITVHWISAVHK